MGFINWFFPSEKQTVIDGVKFEIAYSPASDQPHFIVDLLSIPAMSAAIEVKANDVSQIPINVYMKTNSGRIRLSNNLDYRLSSRPNDYQNAASFWKTAAIQATVGECFISTRGGQLTILPFNQTVKYVTPAGEVRFATMYTQNELRTIGYMATKGPVIKDDYAWNEVWHLWTFQDEFGIPVPLRARFRHVLRLGSDVYRYSSNVYNRGGTIAGYLSTEGKVDDDRKKSVIGAFKKLFARARLEQPAPECPENEMQIAALDNGWKFNVLNLSPQEMMLLETKKDLLTDFGQIVNMPPWKLGITENYHYTSSENAQREYMQSSLNPLLNQIESEINAKAFSSFDRQQGLYVQFNREAIISLDAQTSATIDDLAIKNGCMSTDEWRERRNLPHGNRDIRMIPVNVTSDIYMSQNEQNKLSLAALDLEIKRAQLAQVKTSPATVAITLPAAP